MSWVENVQRGEEPVDSITERPGSPSHTRRWAPYKNNPAEFALSLAEHEGFDAISRNMTPPPSYTRHPQPKLSLLIPDAIQEDDCSSASNILQISPDAYAIESVSESPIEVSLASKQVEASLLNKVRAGLRKRSTGLKGRLRRTSGSSRSSSASTSPNDVVPTSPAAYFSCSNSSSQPLTPCHELPAIQELDGRTLVSTSMVYPMVELGTSTPPRNIQRSMSRSSIVPTPRRGLSVSTGFTPRNVGTNVDPNDLSGRLASLTSLHPDVIVSPCSPISPLSGDSLKSYSLLSRSNAITDTIMRSPDPISPLNALPAALPIVPPTTPTLNGRLHSLPRLTVPMNPGRDCNAEASAPRSGQVSPRGDIVEIDTGKELNPPNVSVFGRLERPFTAPHWPSPGLISQDRPGSPSNAPEIVSSEQAITMASPRASTRYRGSMYTARPYVPPNSFASLFGTACEAAASAVAVSAAFLKTRYGPEPTVPEHHVRVRWRCACGEDLYDDFVENKAGAAAELEAYLNKVPQFWANTPSSSYPNSAASPVFSASGPSPLSSVSTWSTQSGSSPNNNDWRDYSKHATRIATNPYPLNLKPYIDPLWLYTCVNEGKWTTKMRHLDVNSSRISSDKDLALALGSLYSQVHRRWYKFLKLRSLVSIKFVQFELHRNRFADISRSPALPNIHSLEGSTYEFAPHDLSPPVGTNYLMHLFKHPEDYDDELITYLRTPKRRDRLEIGTGWGLELVEGFIAERVWGALIGLLLIGSLVFAVAWTCRKGDDVQTAFGVAGYMVGAAGIVLAWAQAALD